MAIDSFHVASYEDLAATAYQVEDGLVLDLGAGNEVKLLGLSVDDLGKMGIDFG